jgi:hypothetical protein
VKGVSTVKKFFRYLKEAFNLKFGMPLPPSWVFVPFLAIIGIKFPAYAVIGLTLYLCILFLIATSDRFQAILDGKDLMESQAKKEQEIVAAIQRMPDWAKRKYYDLRQRCAQIVADPTLGHEKGNVEATLNQLLYIYYRLTQAWVQLEGVETNDTETTKSLNQKLKVLQGKLNVGELPPNLRESYEAQIQIIETRLRNQGNIPAKIEFIQAECSRIEMQIDLVKEQVAIATQADGISLQVNAITTGLNATSKWINDQQSILGTISDECSVAPALLERS